jgi:hypothetical protein
MRTSLAVGLLVALCVGVGVGTAGAVDSRVIYPDGTVTEAYFLGGGLYGFVAFDKLGDGDIFVHVIDSAAHLVSVPVVGLSGFAFWFDFEGPNGNFLQYGIYACTSVVGTQCTVSGTRRGTLFL